MCGAQVMASHKYPVCTWVPLFHVYMVTETAPGNKHDVSFLRL